MKRYRLFLLRAVILLKLLLLVVLTVGCNPNSEAALTGGSGTVNDPYLVKTREHLENIKNSLDSHYLQVAPIDLKTSDWEPIGDENNPFTGSYDGNEYTISGMKIRGISYAGLFGKTYMATLRNIRLRDIHLQDVGEFSGGLAGLVESPSHLREATIDNCSVTGIISGQGSMIGGLIGNLVQGLTANSWSNVAINATGNRIGGFIGHCRMVNIRGCYSLGNVTVTGEAQDIGGFIGSMNYRNVSDSYSLGSVTVSAEASRVGGFIGNLMGDERTEMITNSFMAGKVTGGKEDIGGLIGGNSRGAKVGNSYWNIETTGLDTSAGGEGRKGVDMTYPYSDSTYVGWDFSTIWKSAADGDVNKGYPYHTLAAPSNVLLTTTIFVDTSKRKNELTWKKIKDAAGYRIYRDDVLVAALDNRQAMWIDEDIDLFEKYTYYITAVYQFRVGGFLSKRINIESLKSNEQTTVQIRD